MTSKTPSRGFLGLFKRSAAEPVPGESTVIKNLSGRAAEIEHMTLTTGLVDEGEIGKGGMSSVRQALDTAFLRRVAAKVLDPEVAALKEGTEQFIDEAQLTGQLEHPGIPPIHALATTKSGSHFFTMKLIEGPTLDDLLREDFVVTDEAALYRMLQIFLKVCEAVAFAHSRGVIHCDLKPSNVMVAEYGQVYVMDWGIARLAPERPGANPEVRVKLGRKRRKGREQAAGTPSYMSPEQASNDVAAIDERTDIFCLGGILYRILAGRAPFVGPDVETIIQRARDAQVVPPEQVTKSAVPRRLSQIALKALSKSRDERYPSAEALQAEVEAFIRGEGRFKRLTVEAGAVLIREGDPGDAAYVIEAGHCRVFKGAGAAELELRTMGPGDVFGEAAIFDGTPRTASVAALDQVTVVVVARESLEHEMGQTLWMGQFVRALARRFIDADARASRLQKQVTQAELAAAVLSHFNFHGTSDGPLRRTCALSTLRDSVAARLGLLPEQVLEGVKDLPGVSVDAAHDTLHLDAPPSNDDGATMTFQMKF